MIISQTPFRISFAGGGSDMSSYYRRHGGAVVSTAIDKYVYVTVSRKFDESLRVSYARTEEVERAAELKHPLVREALGILGIEGGLEITSVADIPSKGTGLGSSSSFSVGLLHALHAVKGRHVPAERLAEEACRIEIEKCGEPIGKQDQYAAAFGGLNLIRFLRDDTVQVEPVILPVGAREELNRRLMMFYTGITRSASEILAEQTRGLTDQGEKQETMGKMVRLAEKLAGELNRGNLEAMGWILDENWKLKQTLSEGISNERVNNWYARAKKAGALGGKLLGAGGGGFLLFDAPPEKHRAVEEALGGLRRIPFRMDPRGSRIVFVYN